MSKTCNECGHEVDDNVQVCPNCGNPMEVENVSAYMDNEVLAQGASTDAESTISRHANAILKFGRIAAGCLGIISFSVLGFLIIGLMKGASIKEGEGILIFLLVTIPGIMALIIWWTSKLVWASIMLFVNISTTLKRIEIKLEKYGTN